MHTKEKIEFITNWIKDYAHSNNVDALVIGISGGIDSAVASTLAAKTGLPVYAMGMPLNQSPEQETLSDAHLFWLQKNYPNVTVLKTDLTKPFNKPYSHERIGKKRKR